MSTTSTHLWKCERTSLTPGISSRGMSSAVTQKARRRTKLPIRSWYAQNSSSSLWHRKHAQLQSILYLMKIQGNTQGNMHSCNQYCTQWKFKDIHRKTCTVAINTVLNENSRKYTGKHAQLQSILYSMKIQGHTQENMHSCNQYCTQWKFKDIHRETCTVAINTVLNENSRTYTGKHAQLQSILYSMKIQGNTQENMHSCNQYCTQWKFKDIHRETCTVAINTVLNENSRAIYTQFDSPTNAGKHVTSNIVCVARIK